MALILNYVSSFRPVKCLYRPEDVPGDPAQLPAHPSCDEHEHRRQEEHHVRHDRHQGYRSQIRQHCPQEGKKPNHDCIHDEEREEVLLKVRFMAWKDLSFLHIHPHLRRMFLRKLNLTF